MRKYKVRSPDGRPTLANQPLKLQTLRPLPPLKKSVIHDRRGVKKQHAASACCFGKGAAQREGSHVGSVRIRLKDSDIYEPNR